MRLKCFSKGEDGTQCSINAHCLIGESCGHGHHRRDLGTAPSSRWAGAAREIVLLADIFEAAIAQRLGLLHRLVEPERVDTEVLALTDKRLLNRLLETELERAFQNEIEAIMRCFGTADAHEATVAFREKRPPVFQGG